MFGKKTPVVKPLQERLMDRSKSVFNSFNSQVFELEDINAQMFILEENKKVEIERIKSEIDTISEQRFANEKLATKIKEFIN